MAGHPKKDVSVFRVAPTGICNGAAQPVFIVRNNDDETMVGDRTVGPDLGARPAGCSTQQVTLESVVAAFKEHPGTSVDALDKVIGHTRNDETAQPCLRCYIPRFV